MQSKHGIRPNHAACRSDAAGFTRLTGYLQLLDWTGRTLVPGKRGRIAQNAPAIVSIIDRNPTRWTTSVAAFSNGWARAAGCAQDLIVLAKRLGQCSLKGIRLAVKLG